MVNLTISVDDDVLRRARIRAVQEGTSVDAVLRVLLESYSSGLDEQARAAANLLSLSKSFASRRGGARWVRRELHERDYVLSTAA